MVAFELDVAALVKAARPARDYVDVPTFPAVTMDQAFVVSEDVTHEKMCQVMTSAGGKLLESVSLFDVYRDEGASARARNRWPSRCRTARRIAR